MKVGQKENCDMIRDAANKCHVLFVAALRELRLDTGVENETKAAADALSAMMKTCCVKHEVT